MISIVNESNINISENQILYFYSSWMPFHKKMMSMISSMEETYKIKFVGIDVDFFKNLCKRFDVKSVPMLIFFKNGEEKKRISGVCLTSALKNAVLDIYNR